VVKLRQLPFRSYVAQLPSISRVTAGILAEAAEALFTVLKVDTPACGSYNVILTRQYLQYIPRQTEFSGRAACNALGFAGTLFVQSAEELEYIKCHGPMKILTDVSAAW